MPHERGRCRGTGRSCGREVAVVVPVVVVDLHEADALLVAAASTTPCSSCCLPPKNGDAAPVRVAQYDGSPPAESATRPRLVGGRVYALRLSAHYIRTGGGIRRNSPAPLRVAISNLGTSGPRGRSFESCQPDSKRAACARLPRCRLDSPRPTARVRGLFGHVRSTAQRGVRRLKRRSRGQDGVLGTSQPCRIWRPGVAMRHRSRGVHFRRPNVFLL